jgi:hypothetical protein
MQLGFEYRKKLRETTINAKVEEDDKGDELITPFCPYCGAYMKNAGDIVAKRSEART